MDIRVTIVKACEIRPNKEENSSIEKSLIILLNILQQARTPWNERECGDGPVVSFPIQRLLTSI